MNAPVTDRRALWAALGATAAEIEELVAYADAPFDAVAVAATPHNPPPPDEPFVDAWATYVEEGRRHGVAATLRRHIVQLRFPVDVGVSESAAYREATRRGVVPNDGSAPHPAPFERPDGLRLFLHQTAAGKVPVIVAATRGDFETLVRALVHRNEPVPVLPAMGACIIGGLVNWSRVADARAAWERAHPDDRDGTGWSEAFAQLARDKARYQDRLIILSSGPYSALQAAAVGMSEREWLARSLTLRLEHECAHYYTRRVFGSMRNSLLDELIADFVGIVAAIGEYRADWFCRFMGVEKDGVLREGGRLWRYRGEPPLSDGAFAVLQGTVRRCAATLAEAERVIRARGGVRASPPVERARWIHALAACGLEALASPEGPDLLCRALHQESALMSMRGLAPAVTRGHALR